MAKSKSDHPRTMLVRTLQGFAPASDYDAERLSEIPIGSRIEATFHQPRNEARHRFYWVILGIVVQNQEHYRTAEDLHWAIKVELRYVEDIMLLDGSIVIRPRSTAFSEMDEIEFRKFFDGAMEVIRKKFGISIEELQKMGRQQMAPRRMVGMKTDRATKSLPHDHNGDDHVPQCEPAPYPDQGRPLHHRPDQNGRPLQERRRAPPR